MSFEKTNTLQISYCHDKKTINLGRLAFINRKIAFEYSQDFLQLGLEISPFKLPLKTGVSICEDRIFEGLFGVFNDSLPDGWGRLLLDRKLLNLGINPNIITPIDRLRYVGTHGMGALQYQPEILASSMNEKKIELDTIAEECLEFQMNENKEFVDELLIMNGSSAGARPKILVSIDEKTNLFQISDNNLLHAHNDWIVKFRSSIDPQDIGSIEYAYHLMAKAAGIDLPEAKIFKSRKTSGFFGVKRFDRTKDNFLHVHTLSGLLHADHRIPSLDYESVMKATTILTKNVNEIEKQFRNAVFNVFSHNRDDHAKNFSFIMDGKGIWKVSPAYDLTFSSGPQGEHCTTIMGNGRNPGTQDLLKLAVIAKIDKSKAHLIINEVKEAVLKWIEFATQANVSNLSSKNISSALTIGLKG